MSAPALDERWWALAGRRGLGARTGARRRGGSACRASASLADAQILYGSGRDIVASGRAPGFEGLLRERLARRGFGDFWGYALVAEGAAEAMVEVGLSAWDAAAPMVVVEEAGGRVDRLRGRRAIDTGTSSSRTACSTTTVRARLIAQ